MALMRNLLLASTVLVGTVAVSTQAPAACNVRGEYCSYPAWAANAFTNPRDRVPDSVLQDADRRSYPKYEYHRR